MIRLSDREQEVGFASVDWQRLVSSFARGSGGRTEATPNTISIFGKFYVDEPKIEQMYLTMPLFKLRYP